MKAETRVIEHTVTSTGDWQPLQRGEIQTVLIVDSDPSTRILARSSLQSGGYKVLDATDIGTAEQLIRNRVVPDIVLIDADIETADLPNACRGLKSLAGDAELSLVALVDRQQEQTVASLRACGADVIAKPVSWSLLTHWLQHIAWTNHAQKDLSASRELNDALLAAIPDTLLVVDRIGEIQHRHAGADPHGMLDRALISATSIDELIEPEEKQKWIGLIEQVLTRSESHSCDSEIHAEDHSWSVEVRIAPYTETAVLLMLRDISRQKRADAEVHRLAFYDTLTGLPNRQSFMIQASELLRRAEQTRAGFSVLCIDLDNFKRINEARGHRVGDALLRSVAARLESCLREDDFVARYGQDNPELRIARLGGDEFTIILADTEGKGTAEAVAERILKAFEAPVHHRSEPFVITPSIGVVHYPDDGNDIDELLQNADTAMYHAKSSGRNQVAGFTQNMSRESLERMKLEHELRRAIEHDELDLHYLPILNLAPKFVAGVEALVRWDHPERGTLSPSVFLPVAEQAGLSEPLGDWVLHAACRQLQSWQSTPLDDVQLSINLSASQFCRSTLAREMLRAVTRHRLMPENFGIELTESMLMHDVDDTLKSLVRLKEAGIRIAIDDFGTGYSSLSYLTTYPLDVIKIDRCFVSAISADGGSHRSICSAVIALAHSLGLTVIAEGVETEEQLQYLHFLDCDQVQGFFFAKPMTATDVTPFLEEHRVQYPRRGLLRFEDGPGY